MLKHYVTYWYPGVFVAEDLTKPISERNPKEAALQASEGAYGFSFHDREETEVDGEVLRGKKKNLSGMYYINGELFDVERVRKEVPNPRTLVSNMEGNGWAHVVKTRTGWFQPFWDDDELIMV